MDGKMDPRVAWKFARLVVAVNRPRWISPGGPEQLPDDLDDEKYMAIPDKRELDLGKPLVLEFAREFLPDDYDEVRHIFSRRGAYRRYKELIVQRGALERWHDFSNTTEEAALRKWCAENGIELSSI
jgi:hypothetical protein